MLGQIFAITIKDLKILFKDRAGMVMLFAMPGMFILVMSVALQGVFDTGTDDKPVEMLVINQDNGGLAGEAINELRDLGGIVLIDEIDGQKLTLEKGDRLIGSGEYQVALVFPQEFSVSILAAATDPESAQATVTFIADPAASPQFLAPVEGAVQGFIQRVAAYAQAPQKIEAGFASLAEEAPPGQGDIVSQLGTAFVDRLEKVGGLDGSGSLGVRFEQVAPSNYQLAELPDSVEQNVPGYTILGVFFIVQVLATSLLREKQEGTFRRLLAAPLSQGALLLGKLLPCYLVNLIQVGLMFSIGHFVFGMSLGSSPLALLVITLATAAASTALGLLVASFGKTLEQIGSLSTLLALTLAAIGGMMVPTFVMPEFMQTLSKVTPHAWSLSAYQDVIVRGLGFAEIWTETGVLVGFAAVFFVIALCRFRFE
ncbi:MAG: ABC transporter permease [Anaerolineales bacterium]|nr:ABC transporter permease [Anaerolineales bacterium]